MASVVAVAFGATLLGRQARRPLTLWLPALSYYAFFVAVILYNYDRFFLPVCVLLAVTAGCWAQDLRERLTSRPLRVAVITTGAAVAVYSFAYAASIDRMMLWDSRYAVESWLAAHVPLDVHVGMVGVTDYLPRISPLQVMRPDYESFLRWPPDFVVVNAEHMARYGPATDEARIYTDLRSEQRYRLVLSQKTEFRWAPLTTDSIIANRREDALTNLDKVNPEILVFEAVRAAR
jgi:hypothetical protein